ncbi:hypothetical protein PT283_10120 [Acetobacteraceae bacterium ESL0697]|nr:hypothetical protein [Acetobacteraceae bacterium ESL0697]
MAWCAGYWSGNILTERGDIYVVSPDAAAGHGQQGIRPVIAPGVMIVPH